MALRRANAPHSDAAPAPRGRRTGRLRASLPATARGRLRWGAAATVLAALPAVFVVALAEDGPRTRLTAEYVRTGSWATGFSAQYVVRNSGEDAAHGWTLRFRLPAGSEVATLWNGRMARDGGKYTIRDEEWNRVLRPGETAVVGFEVRRVDPGEPPTELPLECTINDRPCGQADAAAAPSAEPSATPQTSAVSGPGRGAPQERPATATATASATGTVRPVVPPASASPGVSGAPGGTGTGATRIRPYVDLSAPGSFDLAATSRLTGVADWTLAFVVDGGDCRPGWGGGVRLDDPSVVQRVSELRFQGGDVTISFGGSGGNDLAAGCRTPEALADAYLQVVDMFRVTHIDLDVEGRSLARPDIVERRNQALVLVRQRLGKAGRNLHLTYSLPAGPAGLGAEAVALLRDAATRGLNVDTVNLMAMDYGPANAPNPMGRMARYATDAANTAHGQLRGVWPNLTDAQVWRTMGLTPMIGVADVPGEVFTVADAQELARFAESRHLGALSWWSAARDRGCGSTVVALGAADPGCSGISQAPNAFLRAFTGTEYGSSAPTAPADGGGAPEKP